MYGVPVDLAVMLARSDAFYTTLEILWVVAIAAVISISRARMFRDRVLGMVFLILALLAVLALPLVHSGRPREVGPDYVVARYGDGETLGKVRILAVWIRKDVGIGLLVQGEENDEVPEYLVLPYDPEQARRLRTLDTMRRDLERKGIRGARIEMRVRRKKSESDRRGTQRRPYERNFERFRIQYDIVWPPAPPPKNEE